MTFNHAFRSEIADARAVAANLLTTADEQRDKPVIAARLQQARETIIRLCDLLARALPVLVFVVLPLLTGCAMTPTQKKILAAGVTVIVAGAVVSLDSHHEQPDPRKRIPPAPCASDPKQCP